MNSVFFRFMLFPVGLLYGFIVEIIKYSYRMGWKKSTRSEVATVVIGNLSTGGTGKTPHVEYVLKHLSKYNQLAVLSRGYGRKSKGYHLVKTTDKAEMSGDEPLQIARKFNRVPVIVSEDRVSALEKIIQTQQHTQMVILDDAMQHWALKADSYILLCNYNKPFFKDYILPVGNLREFRFNYKRADMIIVSKCPENLCIEDAEKFILILKPQRHQKVFFSYLKYGEIYHHVNNNKISWDDLQSYNVLFISGIADTSALELQLKTLNINFKSLKYSDHHNYTEKDKKEIIEKFQNLKNPNKVMLCTEKDATKLTELLYNFPLYVVPAEVEIAFNRAPDFQRALVEIMYRKKGYPSG
jgi:tetraacyldisaccharide 4'-kinase